MSDFTMSAVQDPLDKRQFFAMSARARRWINENVAYEFMIGWDEGFWVWPLDVADTMLALQAEEMEVD